MISHPATALPKTTTALPTVPPAPSHPPTRKPLLPLMCGV